MSKKQCKCHTKFYLQAAQHTPFGKHKEHYLTLAAAWMVMWSEAVN